jgi:hypothetical protein
VKHMEFEKSRVKWHLEWWSTAFSTFALFTFSYEKKYLKSHSFESKAALDLFVSTIFRLKIMEIKSLSMGMQRTGSLHSELLSRWMRVFQPTIFIQNRCRDYPLHPNRGGAFEWICSFNFQRIKWICRSQTMIRSEVSETDRRDDHRQLRVATADTLETRKNNFFLESSLLQIRLIQEILNVMVIVWRYRHYYRAGGNMSISSTCNRKFGFCID